MVKSRSEYADAREYNKDLAAEFRANNGVVTGDFAGRPLMLLTTVGAKSDTAHTTPLVYYEDGTRLVVFAAAGGAPKHPAWYHNLVANPTVTIELPGDSFTARASVAKGSERERLVSEIDSPPFARYQAQVEREIPVVVLERIAS